MLLSLLPRTLIPGNNISLYTIPIAWLLAICPHIYAIQRYSDFAGTVSFTTNYAQNERDRKKQDGARDQTRDLRFNKIAPRVFPAVMFDNQSMPPSLRDHLYRAECASLNGYENLGLFAASVVAGNLGILAARLVSGGTGSVETVGDLVAYVNAASVEFLLCRALFNACYMLGSSGAVRGIWFYAAAACCIELCIRGGSAMTRL